MRRDWVRGNRLPLKAAPVGVVTNRVGLSFHYRTILFGFRTLGQRGMAFELDTFQ